MIQHNLPISHSFESCSPQLHTVLVYPCVSVGGDSVIPEETFIYTIMRWPLRRCSIVRLCVPGNLSFRFCKLLVRWKGGVLSNTNWLSVEQLATDYENGCTRNGLSNSFFSLRGTTVTLKECAHLNNCYDISQTAGEKYSALSPARTIIATRTVHACMHTICRCTDRELHLITSLSILWYSRDCWYVQMYQWWPSMQSRVEVHTNHWRKG